jgi:hypothetical protein
MSVWATKRKFIYLSGFAAVLLICLAIPVAFWLRQPPTCTDGLLNGTERGVDCGGSCPRLCEGEALPPTVLWQRAFRVAPGYYNLVAYIENANVGWAAHNTRYSFKVYDTNGLLIIEKRGVATILAHQTFPLFAQIVSTGSRIPGRVVIEFPENFVWRPEKNLSENLKISGKILSRKDSTPRVDAILENKTVKVFNNVEVVAIVYDAAGNAVGASRTLVDSIGKEERLPIVFTWQEPFFGTISRVDIIPKVTASQ